MSFLEAVGEHLVADAIWLAIVSIIVARGVFRVAAWAVFVATVLRRRSVFRFSVSAVLRVRRGTDFLMTTTPSRGSSPPYWAPLGGVIKCRHSAISDIYDLEVQPDWLAMPDGDMDRDLRVKMHGARFWRFMLWYWKGEGRESPSEALSRELEEELDEIGLGALSADVSKLEFNTCAAATTKLFRENGIMHFRLCYVLDAAGPFAEPFEAALLNSVGERLAMVSEADIKRGAHSGTAVGGHSAFLIPGEKYVHSHPAYQ